MKFRLIGIWGILVCTILVGCHRKQDTSVQSSVVTRIDITCQQGDEVTQRSYTSPEKMRLVLLYIRSVSSPFASLPEPEDPNVKKIKITTTSVNNITKVYHQHGEQYFQEGNGGWQKINPEKGGILWELIMAIPGDGEENALQTAAPPLS